MAKIKYYYDTETCKYERVKTDRMSVFLNSVGIFSLLLIVSSILLLLLYSYFESPKEIHLKNEINHLQHNYQAMQQDLNKLSKVLQSMASKDDDIYRKVLGVEPIDAGIRNMGIGGVDRFDSLRNQSFDGKEWVIQLKTKIESLKRKMYIESLSQNELLNLAKNKELMMEVIPAVQPIAFDKMLSLASGYGMRIHPIYKIKKMHTGIDFAAVIGTPVYATADGVIENREVNFSGYGKFLEINHGYGYTTRYAHLHDFGNNIYVGRKVKRGDLIGYVGESGLSTAPHLHYEILLHGNHVNPVHYIGSNLTPEEYERVIEMASIENQSLGM